jgi:pimeloyl-ACP methyl ester carboxylesterase
MIDRPGRFAETTDLSIHYLRAGSGAPVVLLHGWPEFSTVWKHNLPTLAEHFDVIAPDLRGFGKTHRKGPRREGGTPPELLAGDLREFLDALGLARVAIVSHDVGAFVAQAFAQASPERVSALFFFNVPYPGIGARWFEPGHIGEIWYQSFHQKEMAAALVGSSREACRVYFRHFLQHWSYRKDAFDADLETWVDNFLSNGNIQGGFDWYTGVAAYRRRIATGQAPVLPKIKAPTRVLWGRHDPIIKFEWADKLGDYFEDIEVTAAEGSGHFVHWEEPELANRTMIEFFKRVL